MFAESSLDEFQGAFVLADLEQLNYSLFVWLKAGYFTDQIADESGVFIFLYKPNKNIKKQQQQQQSVREIRSYGGETAGSLLEWLLDFVFGHFVSLVRANGDFVAGG